MSFYRKSGPAKAAETRLRTLSWEIYAQLAEVLEAHDGYHTEACMQAAIEVFAKRKRSKYIADAFQRLDEQPFRFGNSMHCQSWHSLLRSVRNSPVYGPKLFAVWSTP